MEGLLRIILEDILAQTQELLDPWVVLRHELNDAGRRKGDDPIHDVRKRNVAADGEMMNQGQRGSNGDDER